MAFLPAVAAGASIIGTGIGIGSQLFPGTSQREHYRMAYDKLKGSGGDVGKLTGEEKQYADEILKKIKAEEDVKSKETALATAERLGLEDYNKALTALGVWSETETGRLQDYEKGLYDEFLRLTEPNTYQSLAKRGLAGGRVQADTMAELKGRAATQARLGKEELAKSIFSEKSNIASSMMNAYNSKLKIPSGLLDVANNNLARSQGVGAIQKEAFNWNDLAMGLGKVSTWANALGGSPSQTTSIIDNNTSDGDAETARMIANLEATKRYSTGVK